ncbi:EAL domain-containing protein [Nocardioides dongxiaopingii]|uniref:EAL domain-containing protein n=1 Tax=Nocardioides sp. S-1144 TaxID=2582905 RepID=UPI00110EBFBC|nr:EAL domain-containing protein [Nocardioides sp. S-1144]QCW49774.1 EAL domain-containing protein [Nocardioides sp. S-1144]
MSGDDRVLIDVLAEAATEMPWPEERIEEWLLGWSRRAVPGDVLLQDFATPPPDVSLDLGEQRFLVARRPPGGLPFSELDRRLLNALVTMATASRHAARRDARLRRQALTDELTGLWQQGHFRELLDQTMSSRSDETLAVLFLDIDGMKRLNETLGHLDADVVLQEIGVRLRSDVLPPGSFAARMGGDEFAAVVRHLEDAADLERLVAHLHETLRGPILVGEAVLQVEVSIGEALSLSGTDDPDALLRRAERQMRQRKRARTPAMLPPRWYDDRTVLRDMIDQGRVEVAYQPVVDLGAEEIVGYEALVRARQLEFGPVSPMMLIGAAAQLRMLDELTAVVLDHGLETMGSIAARAGQPLTLGVNIEFEQLHEDSRLLRSLPGRMADLDVHLVLEISERHVTRWTPSQRAIAAELAAGGIGLAVDDFGAGYSALGLLTSWDWEWVKIDRALIADTEGSGGRTVLGNVSRMIGELDQVAVAEGIETAAEAAAARALGITLAQGTYFAPPAPAEAALASVSALGLQMPTGPAPE